MSLSGFTVHSTIIEKQDMRVIVGLLDGDPVLKAIKLYTCKSFNDVTIKTKETQAWFTMSGATDKVAKIYEQKFEQKGDLFLVGFVMEFYEHGTL